MQKMDTIARITIMKKEKLPILTINEQVRDKILNNRDNAHVKLKKQLDDKRYHSEIRQRKEDLRNLKQFHEKQK